MYVYIYMYIYIYIYVFYVFIYKLMYKFIDVYTHIIYADFYICKFSYALPYVYTYMHTCTDDQGWLRFRSPNDMSKEDAILLGLYIMNDDQNESYIKFVHVLAGTNVF
jgi:hypothetical protein